MCPINESADRSDVVEASYAAAAITVGTSAVEVKAGGSRVKTRQVIYIYNDSATATFYWGPATVTTTGATKGVPLAPGQFVSMPWGDIPVYVVSTAAAQTAIVGEVG
jgi:hypothetical protein